MCFSCSIYVCSKHCLNISEEFKSILIPNKIQRILSPDNIGNNESYDCLKSLSNDFHVVKGDYDKLDFPEKIIQINLLQIFKVNLGLGVKFFINPLNRCQS